MGLEFVKRVPSQSGGPSRPWRCRPETDHSTPFVGPGDACRRNWHGGRAPRPFHSWGNAISVCLGCRCSKTNICRIHGWWSDALRCVQLDALCRQLSDWTDGLSKPDAKACNRVLWVYRDLYAPCNEDEDDGVAQLGALVLLAHPTFSPNMQFSVRLRLECDADTKCSASRRCHS